jgi:hypothetical protein
MVEIKLTDSTYARIREQIAKTSVLVTLTDTLEWDKGECDICSRMTREMLDTHYPDSWVVCEYHGRELGVIW